jgi:hypothetical protein
VLVKSIIREIIEASSREERGQNGKRVEGKRGKGDHEIPNANNAELLARNGAVADQHGEYGETNTEDVGGVLGLESVQDEETELLVTWLIGQGRDPDMGGSRCLCNGMVLRLWQLRSASVYAST